MSKNFLLLITHHSSLLSGAGALAVARQEAGAAVDGAALRRIEGHCGLLPALRALDRDLYALSHAGSLRGGDGREALVLGLLAWLAALGLILQTLVVKEDLLARRPDKIISTVDTLNRAVIEFRLRMTPLPV